MKWKIEKGDYEDKKLELLTWAGVAMSWGESKISKKGRLSGLEEGLRSVSGEEAATEASLERNGSLGLKGILDLPIALTVLRVLNLFVGVKRVDEAGMEVGMDMGTRKHVAMVVMMILLHFLTRHLYWNENCWGYYSVNVWSVRFCECLELCHLCELQISPPKHRG